VFVYPANPIYSPSVVVLARTSLRLPTTDGRDAVIAAGTPAVRSRNNIMIVAGATNAVRPCRHRSQVVISRTVWFLPGQLFTGPIEINVGALAGFLETPPAEEHHTRDGAE
jgi:hypothetical protein